jgi:DnaT-like ssDNA binding protein
VLIVEDGTGLANAESYLSVADANAYHARMGNVAAWSGEVPALEAALRRATQYLDARYKFPGCKLVWTQALQWPRDPYTMSDWEFAPPYWPVSRLQAACAELALRALSDSLYTDQSDAAVTEETVGPLTVKYATAQNGGQVRFAIVDELLSPYTGAGRMSMRLERA